MKKKFVFLFIFLLSFILVGCTQPKEEKSYFVMFDGNGGTLVSGVQTQRVSSNIEVIIPTYEKEGYIFDNWYMDSSLTNLYSRESILENDLYVYAKWIAKQYTIIFNSNGGSSVTTITQDYDTAVIEPTNPTKEGCTFNGWYSDSSLTTLYTFTTMPDKDITLYAKWTINQYTITFDSNEGSLVTAITQDYNTVVTAPTTPTRVGYTFDGWYSDTELTTIYTFTTMPAEDMTLYAKWTINQYKITFNSNEGSSVTTITQDYNSIVTEPTAPTRLGYTFNEWYSDILLTTAYTFTTMLVEDITLYAKWTINRYTITFDSNGGSSVAAITQDYNIAVTKPTDPTKVGYTFDGWYSDSSLTKVYTFTIMPTKDRTLYAKWTINQYTITFNSNEGSLVTAITQDYNTTVTAPTNPKRTGYTFLGWYSDTELTTAYTFTTIPAENITLHAKWKRNSGGSGGSGGSTQPISQYTISFNSNGGSSVDAITQDYNSIVTAPTAPTKAGYTFNGWYSDIELTTAYTFTTMPAKNVVLYTKWTINQYTITFDSNEGSTVSAITQDYNTVVTEPNQPIRTGYTFVNWYSNEELTTAYTFTTMSAENVTLYAKWTINQYTITFDSNEGSIVTAITQDYNSIVTAPNQPTRTGYTFVNWYSDEELTTAYTFTTMPVENVTLYAKWTINQYTITFDSNEGSSVTAITQDYNSIVSAPTVPTREGYTFNGWYSDSELTNIYTFTTMPAEDILLYAMWTINQYTITFNIYDDYNPLRDIPLEFGENIISISLGYYNSAIITSLGRIFTWGENDYGQLGDGTTIDKDTPTDITSMFNLSIGETIPSISLGYDHSSAITSLGRVFTWGYNRAGGLGDGTITNKLTPTDITSMFNLDIGETVVTTSLGGLHSSAITSSGRVFMWGDDGYGQLGDGTQTDKLIPTDITSMFNLGIAETIVSISLGDCHSSAITSLGRIFTWGDNYYGQLGDATYIDKLIPTDITSQFNLNVGETISSISLGSDHSSAITSLSRVFTWGCNSVGQLGNGDLSYPARVKNPVDITSMFNLNIDEIIVLMSLGEDHSSALTSTGRIFTWGYNWDGQLGDGTIIDKTTPIDITSVFDLNMGETIVSMSLGGKHSSALTSLGKIFTWGQKGYGDFSYGITADRAVPTNITPSFNLLLGETIVSISFGEARSSALTSLGRIFVWGWERADMSHIRTTPTDITSRFNLETGETISSISLGYDHSSAITSLGRVFTWGYNRAGGLGDGTTTNKLTPTDITSMFNLNMGETVVSVSLGGSHSSALTSLGRVFTWGYNEYGQLGDGTVTDRIIPTDITSMFNLSEGEKIVFISLGGDHSSALTSLGRVFTWGCNFNSQLGDGTVVDRISPTDITASYNLNFGERIVSIAMGAGHSSAVSSLGRIFVWGIPWGGYFSNRNIPTDITSQFNLNVGETIASVSLGYSNSSVITSLGRMFTWGDNHYGQLGDGTTIDRPNPIDITSMLDLGMGETITSIAKGEGHSSVITSLGRIFTWGDNSSGQLGDIVSMYLPQPLPFKELYTIKTEKFTYNEVLIDYVPIREGYAFDGWYSDSSLTTAYTFTFMPAEDITLYAKWIIMYNITFDSNKGSSVTTITQGYNTVVKKPTDPIKVGYRFNGWYSDSSLITAYTFTTMPAEDITLYAKWQLITYSITYVMNEYTTNDASNPTTYNVTSNISLIDPSVIEGTFIGWFTDEDYTNEIENISNMTGNITLYAKVEMNQYTMTFVTNGGTEISPITQDYDTAIHVLTTKEEFIFVAWCSDEGLTTSIDISKMPNANLTVYAKWAQMYEYFTIDNLTYVYYGTYPQTVVDDSSLISSLNSLTSTNASGYFEYGGEEYSKVVANPYPTGSIFINGSTIQSGQTYYFKVEPIKWRVLEEADGTYTLLSEYIIDKQVFYTSNNTRTIGDQTIYANNYEHSTIREWLNNAFYNKAFSTPEKSSIKATLEVTVNVASITLTGRTEVEVGKTIMLGVTALPEGASNEATFTTSDAAIATVDANGKVTGVAEGMVTITATSKENTAIKDDHVITVKAASTEEPEDPVIMPTSIILSYTNDTVEVGWKLQFSATVYPEGASQNVTWHSRKEEVATIDSKGVLTGVAEGITYIYAVSVVDPTIQSDYQKVTVTPDSSAGIVYPDMQGYVIKIMNASSALTTESSTNPYFSNNTMDKVYLLSYQEAISSTYGFSTSNGQSSTRTAVTTDYARAVGTYMETSTSHYGNGYWWLRSPVIDYSGCAHIVLYDGGIYNYGGVYNSFVGARPAIKIG